MGFYQARSPLKIERQRIIGIFFQANPQGSFTLKEVNRLCFNSSIARASLNDLLHSNPLLESEKQVRWVAKGRKSMYVFRLKEVASLVALN